MSNEPILIRADWIDNPNMKHGGEYVVRDGLEVICRTGAFKQDWEYAVEIAEALTNHRDGSTSSSSAPDTETPRIDEKILGEL